ncbi:hypothetical protein KP509_09G054400 [Ceratopteris richardii]|uniref:Root cap n=1 Tax=Ceratopteris richardii TaxID=49495 RepID=A0A8T2U2M9_CERRI|nr:hypothetical protein KP509_09G054400 [Ceratopteris richardii]
MVMTMTTVMVVGYIQLHLKWLLHNGCDSQRCYILAFPCLFKVIACPMACPRLSSASAPYICTLDYAKCTSVCAQNPEISQSCDNQGAICNDPRFVGGDGNLFYFHGKANEDFCLIADGKVHVNGHFIGKRSYRSSRDFTWVQEIGIIYGPHRIRIATRKVTVWDDERDQIDAFYDARSIHIPAVKGACWKSPSQEFMVCRNRNVNSIDVEVKYLLKLSINATYVDKEDNRIHHYGIDDTNHCFAHLNLHFKWLNVSDEVDGVLGQTYRNTYKSRVKQGVSMPIMGGYEKFKTSSLFSTDCQVARFDPLLSYF